MTVLATLYALHRKGAVSGEVLERAIRDLNIDPEKASPFYL
jgi:pyruvate dehydrogenase complex dehydrogenase (E1) component